MKTCSSSSLSLPDDSAPQQREDHKENQRAPDDEMVDPSPVMRIESQLRERETRDETRETCQISQSASMSAGEASSSLAPGASGPDVRAYLECNSEDQHSEDQRPKCPVSKHLQRQRDKTRCE